MENIQDNNECCDKPGRERSFRGKHPAENMNSDSEEDILVEDWLTAKQGLLDTSDEELNDDLLRSDEENETMRCDDAALNVCITVGHSLNEDPNAKCSIGPDFRNDESTFSPKQQVIAKPYLEYKPSHLAKVQPRCAEAEQSEAEVDPGEVLDIEINAPSGDEFQEVGDSLYMGHAETCQMVDWDPKTASSSPMPKSKEGGAELRDSLSPQTSKPDHERFCRGQPAPKKTPSGPCGSPEPVFPGQHMFDQQHSASVLDTNPPLAGPAPMGSFQPPGYESDPWRPGPALQGPMDLSKPGRPHPGQYPLQKQPLAQSSPPPLAPSGAKAQKPAVLVRAVARMEQSAKPMAVARGMPIAARQPVSAKLEIPAKTPPAPGMVGRNVGQKVKEEPQTVPASPKLPAKPLNTKNNEECDHEMLYMQRLKEQTQLRKQIIKQKEQRRTMQAISRKQQQLKHLPADQHQQKHPLELWDQLPAPDVQQTGQISCPRKVTHQELFHNTPYCPVLERHPQFQPQPDLQHRCHAQPDSPAQGSASGHAAGLRHNQPHQWGGERFVWQGLKQEPEKRKQVCSDEEAAWASGPQEVWQGDKRMLQQRPFPVKIRVVKHFGPATGPNADLTPLMSEECRVVAEAKPRVVTFGRPDSSSPSFLQQRLRLICSKRRRVSGSNQPQCKVAINREEHCAFMSFSSGLKTESVPAQTSANFIVRLNH